MRCAVRSDMVWCDAVRCGAIRCGTRWGTERYDVGTRCVLRCDAVRCGGSCGGGQGALAAPASLAGEDVDLVAAPCLRKGWDGM